MHGLERLGLALFLLVCSASVLAQEPAVEQFNPQGQAKAVRQVTARFATSMAAFGDPRAQAPFDVDCGKPGAGRWIDDRNWSWDFEKDLPGATSCRFRLRAGLADLAGRAVGGQRDFVFSTGGPAVLRSQPREGERIDEAQIFLLGLDAPATNASIVQHAWCRADGINEKIGVRVVDGEERKTLLEARRDFVKRHAAAVALQCRRTLPAGADMALVWGKGIAAANGVAVSEDQELAFSVQRAFSVGLRCERTNTRAGCIPFLPLRTEFSAPVASEQLRRLVLEERNAKGVVVKRHAPELGDEAKGGFADSVRFPGPFSELSTLRLHLPADLRDDAGRPLSVSTKRLSVKVDRQPPLIKFAAPFGIIEAKGDRLLPVTVRNVEPAIAAAVRSSGASVRVEREQDVMRWLGRLNAYGKDPWSQPEQSGDALDVSVLNRKADGVVERFALPKPNGRRAFEVIGIPLRKPGFYVVELSSPQLGRALNDKPQTAYVRSAALVTNLAAHLKRGAESSLVWVTSLDKGRPVAKARVAVRDCAGAVLWSGVTGADGMARIDQELARAKCGDKLFVSARSGDDFTFTLSSWQQGIETWRFQLPQGSLGDDTSIVATVFDRTLLRAGETVHMKHFLRRHTGNAGLALVARGAMTPEASIVHEGSGDEVALKLAWDALGQAHNTWTIPAQAKLGSYRVLVGGQVAGEFRVEQFRVPTMKAILKPPAVPSIGARSVTIDAQVNYLNGGPAGQAPVVLRSTVDERGVSVDAFEGFTFGGGDVKEGVEQLGNEDDFDEAVEDEAATEGERQGAAPRVTKAALDKNGAARITVDALPPSDLPRSLLAELSWQDANGETLSASIRVPLWPAGVAVGIKPAAWMNRERIRFQVAVVNVDGKPAPDSEAVVDFFQRETRSHRRRLVGGFYAYESTSEIKRVDGACRGRTDARGLLACDVPAPAEGNIILRATSRDAAGRATFAQQEVHVAGKRDGWFDVSDNDRIDLLPSKARFEPGEQASFQLRSPFRGATVLVTVEREGILDSYVRRVTAADPSITIPVKANYAPNVYVSALVVRGRVAGVKPTALVDLGKPAYKLGIAPMKVGWAGHELKVVVQPDRQVYKVR